jgi:8-oxo-dGTP pyrophosphatase MutT (NUDIX family)
MGIRCRLPGGSLSSSMLTVEDIRRLVGRPRATGKNTPAAPEGYARAAVLVPIVAEAGDLHLLLTVRTEDVETHKGQIAFPGGTVDPLDTDIVHTALRETEEEVGVNAVEVVGILEDLVTPTRFVITPVVGLLHAKPDIIPNPWEVAEVFFVPLSFFADPEHARSESRMVNGSVHTVWLYDYEGRTIWGATAAIIRSLLKRLEIL